MRIFKSAADEAAYTAAYNTMLAKWPVPTASRFVQTRLGRTHVIEAGLPDAPPLVLVPAVSVSATSWFALAGFLATRRRLFAVDIVGDAGLSVADRRPVRSADYADWLAEVVAELGLRRPAIAGHSYGGWLTLALAIHRPDAVGPVIVLAPAASLAPFYWYSKAFLAAARWLPLAPSARSILRMQAHKGFVLDETFVQLVEAMTRHVRTDLLFPELYSDDELGRIQSDTLVLVGDGEVLYSPRAALERAARLIPKVTGSLVPDCSHLLIMERPKEVAGAMLSFLDAREARSRQGRRLSD